MTSPEFVQVTLREVAHGRTGDKGDTSNISVIAWHTNLFASIVDQVTPEAVERQFAFRNPKRVRRFLLPQIHSMNFTIEGALDGGVNNSLNLDGHGKSFSFLLLDIPMLLPPHLMVHARRRTGAVSATREA